MAARYGKFGASLNEIDDKKKKKKVEQEKPVDPNDEFAGGNPNVPRDPNEAVEATSAPQRTSGGNPLQNLKPIPKLYEGEGKDRKINPQYNTSIWQDMAAQAGMQRPTGDNYFDIGAKLGGLVGGIFNKNIAGKVKYQQDVQRIQQENKDTIVKTEAYQRAEQAALAQQREARLQQATEFRQQMAMEKQKVKGQGDTSRFLTQAAQAAPTPEARMELSQQFNELWGIEDAPNPNFGQKYKVEKIGDYAMLFDEQTGELIQAKGEDGRTISALDSSKQLDILKKWTGLSEKETPDLEAAMAKADEYIAKNFKGGLKAQQYNSLKMQLSREILKMQKQGGTGKVVVNGQVIPLPDLSIMEQKPPLAKDPSSPEGNSPFMTTQPEGNTQVTDATKTVGGDAPPDGQPPANIPQVDKDGFTMFTGYDTVAKKQVTIRGKEVAAPANIKMKDGEQKKLPSGKTVLFKDGKLYILQ